MRIRRVFGAVYGLLPFKGSPADVEGASDELRRALPANFAAVALNGLFFPTAGRVLGAGLLLTWFLSELNTSAFVVVLVVPIQYGLSLLAQPFVGAWLATRPRRIRFYLYQALARGALWVALGVAAWALDSSDARALLAIFFAAVVGDAVAAGVGNIVVNDAIGRVIPERVRGRARSWRGALGGVTAGLAGLLVRFYAPEGSGLDTFAILFALAGALYALGGVLFAAVEEPEDTKGSAKRPRMGDILRKIGEIVRRPGLRRFLVVQSLLVPVALGLPFFTLFGTQTFGLEIEALGLLLAVDALTPIVANLVWGPLADALGNQSVIAASALCGSGAAAVALSLYATRGADGSGVLTLGLFASIVAGVGAASAGFDLATKNYVLELAPDDAERPLYIGTNDMLVGIPTMLLAGAGGVVDLFGFGPLFAGLLVAALVAASVAWSLPAMPTRDERSG